MMRDLFVMALFALGTGALLGVALINIVSSVLPS